MRAGIAGLALVAALLVAGVAPAAAAPQPALTVALATDGDATVSVTYTFDLSDDGRRAAFRSIRDNESVRQAYADRYETRLRGVASATAARTGRSMSVGDASAEVRTAGDTGVVTLAVEWTNLARTDGDRLVLHEPFASEFVPNRRFVVDLPDGYAAEATPSPDERADGRLTWTADSDLSGFELTAAPDGEGSGSSALGPGVGAVGALVALVSAALWLGYRA